MRNFEEIAVLADAQPGASMEYDDNTLAPGLYEYEIFVSIETENRISVQKVTINI